MKSRRLLATILLFTIVAPSAFADGDPVQTACEARVTAGLIESAVVGIISDHAQKEILCGNATSERQAFELGSISKSFAGIALAKLSLRGRVDLEAPLSTYVPELQGSYMGTTTPHQLATHTSLLIRSYSDSKGTSSWQYDETQLLAFLRSYRPNPVTFPPGTRLYSNVGFGALGLVLSRVEGKPYSQIIQDEILSPMGMADTGFFLSPVRPDALVQGYDVLLNPAAYWPVSDLASAPGGVYSDLHDMLLFLSANLNADSSELGRAIQLSQTLGLGWDSLPGKLPVWKNGLMTSGFGTIIQFDPARGLGSVVLGNEGNAPSIEAIGSVAMGNPDLSHQLPLSTDYITSVTGRYVATDGSAIQVLPVRGTYLGIESTVLRGLTNASRLLTVQGADSKFWINNGSDDSDQISFELNPVTMQMQAVYYRNAGKDSSNHPIYVSRTFEKR